MKIPQRPPSTRDLRATLEQVATDGVRGAAGRTPSDPASSLPVDDYLHWDDLRRRTPPDGFDLQSWWALLKLGRTLTARKIPLSDASGVPFQWSSHDRITEALHGIDLRAGGLVGMPEPITNPDSQRQYYLSSLVTEAITSSQIEGASTTREVAREMLFTRRSPRDRSERMILNNYLTMERIHALRDTPLSPDLIFELHRLVTTDTLDKQDATGRLRSDDEQIAVVDTYGEVLHTPPPARELESRLAALCDFANGTTPRGFVHPVLRAIMIHFWLAYDHPFVDGNGRCARALFYWSMLRSRYWLFEYVSISEIILRAPTKYGRAFLLTETDDNDLTYFLLYHLDVIRESLDALEHFIARRAHDLRSLETLVRGAIDRLNARQRDLLSHALRHPHEVYTIAGHQARQGVVYQTARTDLLGLADLGLLERSESGKKLVFRPASNLEGRLRALR